MPCGGNGGLWGGCGAPRGGYGGRDGGDGPDVGGGSGVEAGGGGGVDMTEPGDDMESDDHGSRGGPTGGGGGGGDAKRKSDTGVLARNGKAAAAAAAAGGGGGGGGGGVLRTDCGVSTPMNKSWRGTGIGDTTDGDESEETAVRDSTTTLSSVSRIPSSEENRTDFEAPKPLAGLATSGARFDDEAPLAPSPKLSHWPFEARRGRGACGLPLLVGTIAALGFGVQGGGGGGGGDVDSQMSS